MTERASAVPNPGSIEAANAGCTCPRIDNHYGRGIPTHVGRQFIMFEGCPLHWPTGAFTPTFQCAEAAHD